MNIAHDGTSRENQKSSVLPWYDATSNDKFVFGTAQEDPRKDDQSKQLFPRMKKRMKQGKQMVRFTRAKIPQNTLVLDSGATVHLISNPDMMQNLHNKEKSTTIHCGGKSWRQTKAGELCDDLKGLPLPQGEVLLAKDGIANLLSLAEMTKLYRICFDSAVENAFYVFKDDGSYIKFERRKNGLYMLDVDDGSDPINLLTVQDQMEKFSEIDVKKATLLRYIQECLCLPADVDLANGLDSGVIQECGVDRRHVKIANEIYGPNKHALEGKTVQKTNSMVRDSSYIEASPSILAHYKEVTLGVDVLFINKVPYLFTISRHIKFIQCLCIRTQRDNVYIDSIRKMKTVYEMRGFMVTKIYADRAFESCRSALAEFGSELICCDKNAHVHFAERGIRFVKERIRCIRSMLPTRIKRIPKRLMMEIVYATITMMNSIHRKGGVHGTMSPRTIVTGKRLRIPPYPPGAFIYGVHGNSSNSIDKMRTFDALYLRPNDGGGGHFVYNIHTMQRNSVHRVIGINKRPIPMTQITVDLINQQAKQEQQPDGIVFGDIDGVTTLNDFETVPSNSEDDDDDDRSYLTSDDQSLDGDHDLSGDFIEPTDETHDLEDAEEDPGVQIVEEEDNDALLEDLPDLDPPSEDEAEEIAVEPEQNQVEPEAPIDIEEIDEEEDEAQVHNEPEMIPEQDPEFSHLNGPYWAMGSQGRTDYCLSIIKDYGNVEATLSSPQYGFEKGLKLFRKKGYKATMEELDENLLGKNVIDMLDPSDVSWGIFQMSLAYLMFLKRKRSGKIKARGCADGRPQREYITKLESSAPTVKIHALFVSCLIDAVEGRRVAITDIPGAFLSADWPPSAPPCYLRFEGVMVDMICELVPEYKELIRYSGKRDKFGRRKRWLVGKVTKAIYGTLLGAILFYNKLKGELIKMDFEMNDYDECTFNKMVNGTQITIQFHVDDLKISHVSQTAIDDVIDALNAIFGKDKKMSASYGKIHEYLGMTIDWSEEDMVKFTMYDYLEDILLEAPDEMDGTDVTPAAQNLFHVDEESPDLDDETADFFHRMVARFLYAAKRARPDIQVAVAFLCKRVKCPNQGDWKKLGRLVRYVRDTIHIPLVLGWDGSGNLVWSIDASFAVHMDMKSHTGYCLTMGRGSTISGSTSQNITTRSSTQAELVGIDDAIGFVEWTSLFCKFQVKDYPENHPLKKLGTRNLMKQDNTSTIKMAKGGRRTCGKRTRCIEIRYFYITEKINEGLIVMSYCPTKEMVSDYLSKPIQGSLFRMHRNAIMGITNEEYDRYELEYAAAKKRQRLES